MIYHQQPCMAAHQELPRPVYNAHLKLQEPDIYQISNKPPFMGGGYIDLGGLQVV